MSEVVVHEALDLSLLSRIVCRTSHELRTFEHLLEELGVAPPKIIIEQRGSIFMRMGIFLDEVYALDGDFYFKFHAPTKSPQPEYKVRISKVGEGWERIYSLRAEQLWRIQKASAMPDTVWRIEVEGCLAYLGKVPDAPAGGRIV
jgi:hypothetical protein